MYPVIGIRLNQLVELNNGRYKPYNDSSSDSLLEKHRSLFSVLFLMAKRKCKLSAFEGTEIRPSSSSPQGWYLVIITMNSDVTVDL